MSKIKLVLNTLAIGLLLSNSVEIYAADNPLGTTLTTTLTGSAPLTNEGVISVSGGNGISGTGVITNSGSVSATGSYNWGIAAGQGSDITNSGSISAHSTSTYASGIIIGGGGSGNSSITNASNATIQAFGSDSRGVELQTNSILNNAGIISGGIVGVIVFTATNVSITNTGSILGGVTYGGIFNTAVITTLNNAQGAGNTNGALTYRGALPTNYNIIINAPTSYGKLAVITSTGSTAFDIYAGSSVAAGTYASVITGTSSVTHTSGTYDGLTWVLNNSSGTWDLVFTGASTTYTQASLHSLASRLRGAFSSQAVATNFANMNTYDCDLFDDKGICVSVGGQQTYVDNPSSNLTSTVVVAGYKVSPTLRIGGFLNQNINNNTVAGVHISNANPLMGLFAVWNQNEDHLGYQVKVANAYQDKDVSTIRDAVATSEPGRGSTTLNTQSFVGELSYAFLANEDKTLVRPYAALRYTRIKQDGYTEATSAGVTAPLTYAALEDRSTTALVGVKLNHKLADKVNLTGSLGIEQDLYHQVDNLTATGVSGLTSENFNDNIKRTRPVASIGAYYMPVKNQRIAADLYYQQLPFQSTASTTAYVNYTIGF